VALDFVMVKIVESGTSMKYNAENTFVLFYFMYTFVYNANIADAW